MKRQFLITGDGSITIHLPEWNEQYHSKHGAIAEAKHVFLEAGLDHCLKHFPNQSLNILEIGFGTGLNAFLTLLETQTIGISVVYTGVEAYPVAMEEVDKLNYTELVPGATELFGRMHELHWEQPCDLTSEFQLLKQKKFFSEINEIDSYHLVYFDAFGPRVQPELWTEDIFRKMFIALKAGGVLVTYSAKGSVRRAMQAVGFEVERLPGPPGKREMLRAVKPS
ncbi:tRNA (5-methylaminomethyl-2-thiouridine)(34)-methyltransferase MnmD [Aureitalea sp. L0-47]|uniref:tRNA (5-methylaminomethyl-2-thiouridine)(34)-methyltransferase MnmD n=1 Tax=Aureitalea sp. L0-47 TaxID=2816962 RepID=UPI0022381285|nr:tRNA (5-methylaminomethyl-2-thiouridine)(34)-methyltransferase MnmD [Aureitalea sp. L0-47]MCW5519239.1 tRNA (5-methylaminomethyl-2-thiouridine)(34)-methyltransferase MnmD [Aureitalea sp. L0-47]